MLKALCVALLVAVVAAQLSEDQNQFLFSRWVAQYNKAYASAADVKYRYNIWKENLETIRLHNEAADAGKHSYTLAMNEFGDLSHAEFVAGHVGKIPERKQQPNKVKLAPVSPADESIDWRAEGAVTPVKNQQQCGSCWAFSVTGTLEGMHFLDTRNKTGKGELISLSEQQLVDCTRDINFGCQGGWPDKTIDWLSQNGGSCKEADYKYTARDGTCKKCTAAVTTSGVIDLQSEDDIYPALTATPVSILIEADQSVFQFYKSGVFDDQSCGTNIDHAVLVVGYTSDKDYWIVKNSWGTSWGAQGYIFMKRGINICGISTGPAVAKP